MSKKLDIFVRILAIILGALALAAGFMLKGKMDVALTNTAWAVTDPEVKAGKEYDARMTSLAGVKAGRGWIRKYKQRPVPLDEGEADFGRGVSPEVRKQIARLAKRQMSDPRVREAKVAALLRAEGFAVISS